jgi:hypothetical protein
MGKKSYLAKDDLSLLEIIELNWREERKILNLEMTAAGHGACRRCNGLLLLCYF